MQGKADKRMGGQNIGSTWNGPNFIVKRENDLAFSKEHGVGGRGIHQDALHVITE